jgi:hypothetical protein
MHRKGKSKVSERRRETPVLVHKRLRVSDGSELLVEKHDKVDEMVE